MSKDKMKIVILAFAMMLCLLATGLNYIIAGVITIVVVMMINGGKNYNQYKDRSELLQSECDPEAFLKMTSELKLQSKNNPKMSGYLVIDEAVGLMTQGMFEQARDILLAVDSSKLPTKYHIDLIHKMNLMYCHYELGEIEAAELVYEDILPLLSVDDLHVQLTKEVLLAERAFFLAEYEESKALIEPLLERQLKKRTHLTLVYRLAQMAELEGDFETAKAKYAQVAEEGNKLQIAIISNEKLNEMAAISKLNAPQ